jgi:RNA polymerase sigma-70 factor (ECF subfamily)
MMREIEEMTTAETAECLEITEEAVKMRLHRARELVRADLYSRAGAASSKAFEFLGQSCDRLVQAVFQRIHSLR